MSKRSNEKRITMGSRTLKFLREQAKLSVRAASRASGVGDGVINHLENGRMNIHPFHLEKLLPAYGVTVQTYEMFASGQVPMPQNLRFECIEIIKTMSFEKLRTAHPVLLSLSTHK
jgi:transcriptional regulator with XRE-family HTH domain